MAWDKDLPSGSKDANVLDNDIRTNNAALETALDQEHSFVTGNPQDGKHKFAIASSAAIASDTDYVAGAMALANNLVSGYVVPVFFDGTDWWNPFEPFLDLENDWVLGQHCTPDALTPGASVASDWGDANVFTLAVGDDPTDIANPSGLVAGKSAVRYYIITQSDPVSVVTWGTYFNGDTDPVVSDQASSITVVQCVQTGNATIQATVMSPTPAATATIAGVVELATDAEAATGTDATRALTPDNLGQNFTATATAGHAEIIGTGLQIQWIHDAAAADNANLAFEVAFGDADYICTVSVETAIAPVDYGFTVVDDQNITIRLDSGPANVHVIAIGTVV